MRRHFLRIWISRAEKLLIVHRWYRFSDLLSSLSVMNEGSNQEGSSISRQNMNENLKTLHIAPTLFYNLLCFLLKTGILNPHPLSLGSNRKVIHPWQPQIKCIRVSIDHFKLSNSDNFRGFKLIPMIGNWSLLIFK